MTAPLRVAICGGGIAGVCLASALTKYPHIQAHVYEGNTTISETGAGFGVPANAQKALRRIRPELHDALARAGAIAMDPSYRFVVGMGNEAGKLATEVRPVMPELALNRGKLLEQFVRTVPASCLHTGKKLVKITGGEDDNEELCLHFEDGSSAFADALVGTDGIRSFTRQYVLGAGDSSLLPIFSGLHLYFNMVSVDDARAKLGDAYTSDPCLTGYIGKDAYLMNVPVEGKMMVLAQTLSDDCDWAGGRPVATVAMEDLERRFKDWGPLAQPILELLSGGQPQITRRAILQHSDTTAFSRGRVCMLGDAAHTMVPWVGAGAAMAIEDVLVLSTLLGRISSPCEVEAAFKAYDSVRRPRVQRVSACSRRLGDLLMGSAADVGFDLGGLEREIPRQWSWIEDVDLDEHVGEAVELFDSLRSR